MTARPLLLSILVVSGCCFGGTPASTGAPPATAPTAPVAPPLPVAPPAPVALATLSAGPGMTPDPATSAGLAGGPVPASALAPTCMVGSYPVQPQVTVRVTGVMPNLTIFASSDSDLTLAVRRPDGTFLCNDDGDIGVNPRFSEPAVPGDYTVYVGTYGSTTPAPYTLGVSSTPAMATSLLGEGPILRRGHLRVLTATGAAMVSPPGTICDYVEVAHAGGLDVRWRVVCGDNVYYGNGSGEGSGGYSYSSRPEWPPGTLIRDVEPTGVDRDSAFIWDASGIHVFDDAANIWTGAYDLTFAEAP